MYFGFTGYFEDLSDAQLGSGVVTLCYASRYELLIAGTRKGEIALIDIRQNTIRNIFQAHESCISSIKLDPLQYYFVSSAYDGHIKVCIGLPLDPRVSV